MLKRVSLVVGLILGLAGLCAPNVAWAQDEDEFTLDETEEEGGDEGGDETPADETIEDPDLDIDLSEVEDDKKPSKKGKKSDEEMQLGATRVSWQDIVVVMRKPFLKMGRVELVPTWGVTINDNMIQHYAFAANFNYFLSDILAVGVEAQIFTKSLQETHDLVARQDRRLPTLNQYNYAASLNFHYVPIYGKFATFNNSIVHWEWYFTAGVGFTQSEILPRDPALPSWTNFLITPNVGITMRVFLADWVTINLGIRDYIFVDKFEDVGRDKTQELPEAMADADSKLINHIMFQAGVSFWFPTSFEYTTFR